jgi:hypothetical protein
VPWNLSTVAHKKAFLVALSGPMQPHQNSPFMVHDWWVEVGQLGFHPIPLGVSRRRKKKKIWKIKCILFALLNPSYVAVIQ